MKIMAVPKEKLGLNFQGFSDEDFFPRIVENAIFDDRPKLEEDPSHKQPIPYLVFVKDNKIYCYRRSKRGNEARLHEKYSIGFGGHVEPSDGSPENAIHVALQREAEEELEKLPENFNPELIGYINDDSNDVGKVHLGLLHIVPLDEEISHDAHEASEGEFKTVEEIEEIYDKLETWSQIAIKAVKERLK